MRHTLHPLPALAPACSSRLSPWPCSCAPALADGVAPGDANAAQKKEAIGSLHGRQDGVRGQELGEVDRASFGPRSTSSTVPTRASCSRALLRESGALGDAWAEYGRVIEDATKLRGDGAAIFADGRRGDLPERTEVEAKLAFVTITVVHAPEGDTMLKVGGRSIPADQWAGPILAPAGRGRRGARRTRAARSSRARPSPQPAARELPSPSTPSALARPCRRRRTPTTSPTTPSPAAAAAPAVQSRAGLRPYAYIAGGVGVAGFAAFTSSAS